MKYQIAANTESKRAGTVISIVCAFFVKTASKLIAITNPEYTMTASHSIFSSKCQFMTIVLSRTTLL